MACEVEVSVGEGLDLPITPAELEGVVRWVLEAEAVEEAEISLALLGDEEIAALNEQYLRHEGPTDVISFALHAEGATPLGDVYIGAEQAARQAAELGVPLREELVRLAVHGTLHVLGHDHPIGAEREACPMYVRQEELLRGWLAR